MGAFIPEENLKNCGGRRYYLSVQATLKLIRKLLKKQGFAEAFAVWAPVSSAA